MASKLEYLIGALWNGRAAVTQARQDIDKLGDTGERSSKQVERVSGAGETVRATFAKLVATGVIAGAGMMLVDFGRQAIDTASDVEEMQSKFNTVFGAEAGSVTAELGEFADAANRSIFDLQGFAATLQDTFVPLGFARDAAADLSVESVKLAEDLASFNNLETAQVIEDIQSALVGNTETLRKYGVVASQAAIEQEAYESGIWSGEEAITAQEKALAIYQLTLQSTTDAQGDAVRTADSYANKQKGLEAALTDLQVVIGQTLLPVATDLVGVMTELADQAATSAQAVSGEMGEAVEGLVRQNVEGAASTIELAEEYHNLRMTWEDAGFWGRLLTGTTDELNEGFGLLALRVIETSSNYEEFERRGTAVFQTTGEFNRALEQLADQYVIVTGNIAPTNEELFRFYQETAQAQDQAGILAEKMGRVAEMSVPAAENIGLLAGQVDLATVEFDDLALVVGNATTATDDLTTALQNFAKEQYRSSVEVDGLDNALAKARELRSALTGVRSTRSGDRVDVGGGTGSTSDKFTGDEEKRAGGGPFAAGGMYQVGERGPEVGWLRSSGKLFMIPGEGGQVFSNQQSREMFGGGDTIVINNNSREAAALTMATMAERKRQRLDSYMGVA